MKKVNKGNNKKPLVGGNKDAIGNAKKPRLSLIPFEALWALGGALTYGEVHYGTHNWRKGIQVSYLLDAALRHISQFNNGEDIDPGSNNNHLGNAMANLSMAIWMIQNKPEFDDRIEAKEDTDDNTKTTVSTRITNKGSSISVPANNPTMRRNKKTKK